MGIKMNMFPGEQMTANDDGMIYNQMIPRSGILHGCEMTFMGANQIHIAKGKLMIKGRLCTVTEETIQVEMASTDVEVEGRLYVHVDLSDTQEPVKFMSVAQTPLPDLVKNEDINHENGVYEIELATYTAGRTAITNMVVTCEEIPDMGDMEKLIGSPDEYSSKKTYKKGDYCIRENTAYVANTDIPEAEEWTEAHWDETSIFGIIREQNANLTFSEGEIFRVGKDADGNRGYYVYDGEAGTDVLVPFGGDISIGQWNTVPTSGEFTAASDGFLCCWALLQTIPTWSIDGIPLTNGDGKYSYKWSGGGYSGCVLYKKGNIVSWIGANATMSGIHCYTMNLAI